MIEARDLTRRFRRVDALRGVSLSVSKGERFGIVGESGSGKSTLVRLLAALDRPTSGSIRFGGREITGLPERRLRFLRKNLQMVFQDPMSSLDPRMRVRDIITEPVGAGSSAAELLEAVGLPPDAANRYPHQFSGGQRQRIAIARALSPRPAVLIADEPVSALDVSVRAQILNLLSDVIDEFGLTLVFVRHVCENVAVMRHGEIVESGPVDRVWSAPSHPYTQELLEAILPITTPTA